MIVREFEDDLSLWLEGQLVKDIIVHNWSTKPPGNRVCNEMLVYSRIVGSKGKEKKENHNILPNK